MSAKFDPMAAQLNNMRFAGGTTMASLDEDRSIKLVDFFQKMI
jgi:hypothetical protein